MIKPLTLSDRMISHFKELFTKEEKYAAAIESYDAEHIIHRGEPSFGESEEAFLYKDIEPALESELVELLKAGLLRRYSRDPERVRRFRLTPKGYVYAHCLVTEERCLAVMNIDGIEFTSITKTAVRSLRGEVFTYGGGEHFALLNVVEPVFVNDRDLSPYLSLSAAFESGLATVSREEYAANYDKPDSELAERFKRAFS